MRQKLILFQTLICLTVFGLCTFGLGISQSHAEISVDASLSQLSFPQDRVARLTITVNGTSQNTDIELPEIDNIRLQNQGQASQISVINGTISSSISNNYLVQAVKPGAYTIPPIKVIAEGNSYMTKPLHFNVTPAGQAPQGYSAKTGQTAGDLAFIRVSKTGSHYSGEIVPFTIKAYFNQAYRAEINSSMTLHGDGVLMSQLQDKPRQTEESVNGRMYHVLTWNTSLSGIKAGDQKISFSLDATLLIPQKRRSLSPFGGNNLFDDSFFDNSGIDSFFNNVQRKPLVVVSPQVIFKVLPLPTDNQPENFTGAIGDFDLKVSAKPTDVEIGEPITLTMEIAGTGNFDRVEAPAFPESGGWKTYPPTSSFSKQGESYSGAKSFEQAIVAKSGAVTEIPSLSFSYFDPQQKKYITKSSESIAINVKKPANSPVALPVPPVTQQQTATQTAKTPTIAGLAPIHLEPGTYHDRIDPLFKNSWFIVVCGLCLITLLVLSVLKIQQRNIQKHPEIQLQRRKKLLLEHDLEKLTQAQTGGESLTFLTLARATIQNQLGLLWNIEPAALSLADIRSRLNADSQLIEIFSAAEQAAYGGASLTTKKMQQYLGTLKTELENLL